MHRNENERETGGAVRSEEKRIRGNEEGGTESGRASGTARKKTEV